MGLMLAMDLDSADTAKAAVGELLAKGILINRTHDTVLRFLPPYIAEKKHVDQVIDALDVGLVKIKGSNRQGHKVARRKAAAA
jgi:acetylornithine aminotransferase/acetylornithine/N-succinyldiaminopimelate aminotransferase